jgi:glyoxylase-like metal-dependent hydrolase (beta-lactamase superfamily II)
MSDVSDKVEKVAEGVYRVALGIVNVYFVGSPGATWAMVDAGTPGTFEAIRQAAQSIYGNAPPSALLLTHAHPDHYGAALDVSAYYDIPIYAHRLELPYLTGQANVPPLDHTQLGLAGVPLRFMPCGGIDLGERVQALPGEAGTKTGLLPGFEPWQWHHTPGHTPGHIALFRPSDKVLIAGDALATVDTLSILDWITGRAALALPLPLATTDWVSQRKTLLYLSDLRAETIAAGHGTPLSGVDLPEKMVRFAEEVIFPLHGRYVVEPARFSEKGVEYLPPPAPDPNAKLAVVGVAAIAGAIYLAGKKNAKGKNK